MRKYRRSKKRIFNPYMLFSIAIIGIITMSVGYAMSTDKLVLQGFANARYERYEILYELDGGVNPENAVNSFTIVDDVVPLPIPTKAGYTFVGWFDNDECVGNVIRTTEGFNDNIILYAKWKKAISSDVVFDAPGIHVFDGTNYINTNVYLYTEENVNKNFMMSFNIESVDESNINHAALANSMDESGIPWPGHVLKYFKNNDGTVLKFESNSNTSGEGNINIASSVKNIRIFRIDNYMYVSLDGGYLIKINDYNGFTDTFNIPVTFGADVDVDGNAFRFFKGSLSDLHVEFLDESVQPDDFNPNKQTLKVVYEYPGQYAFDGTNYINTGLTLFDRDNFGKDFEISFNIDEILDGYVNQAVLVNGKNERITTYPGFVYRLYVGDKTVRFEAKAGSGSGAKNKQSEVQSVKIIRKDSVMYLSINGGEAKKVYDYTNFNSFFDVPITIGASLDKDGNPFRYFIGTLSNIVIKVEE